MGAIRGKSPRSGSAGVSGCGYSKTRRASAMSCSTSASSAEISSAAAPSQFGRARPSSRAERAEARESWKNSRAFFNRTSVSPARRGSGGHSRSEGAPLRAPASLVEPNQMPSVRASRGCSPLAESSIHPAVRASLLRGVPRALDRATSGWVKSSSLQSGSDSAARWAASNFFAEPLEIKAVFPAQGEVLWIAGTVEQLFDGAVWHFDLSRCRHVPGAAGLIAGKPRGEGDDLAEADPSGKAPPMPREIAPGDSGEEDEDRLCPPRSD